MVAVAIRTADRRLLKRDIGFYLCEAWDPALAMLWKTHAPTASRSPEAHPYHKQTKVLLQDLTWTIWAKKLDLNGTSYEGGSARYRRAETNKHWYLVGIPWTLHPVATPVKPMFPMVNKVESRLNCNLPSSPILDEEPHYNKIII